MRGGRNSSGECGISSGNLFLVSGKPAVVFGTVTKPGAQEELTYVLVFRHALSGPDLGFLGPPMNFHSSSGGRKTESRDAITIRGKRIEASYEVELNETQSAVMQEALTAGGGSKEVAAGRVFLVDLDGESPTYRQKSLTQPPPVAPLGSPADVERMGGGRS
jgi:hypothetical protein